MDKTLVQYNIKKKKVFEGYYFKHTFEGKAISFIVGFSTVHKHAFIQVIESDPTISRYYRFDIEEINIINKPFTIEIAGNFFSFDKVVINLDDYKGIFHYGIMTKLDSRFNIMGPFSLLPRMECNHAIVSMDHSIDVDFQIRDKKYSCKGNGYIEKDYGRSFPKNYIWVQCNDFEKRGSFFFSLATIPYMNMEFDGVIANFVYNNNEYRFATYNNSKYTIVKCEDDYLHIILKHKNVKLEVTVKVTEKAKLVAPIDGEMIDVIKDGMNGKIKVKLYYDNVIVHQDSSNLAAVEIVNSHYFKELI